MDRWYPLFPNLHFVILFLAHVGQKPQHQFRHPDMEPRLMRFQHLFIGWVLLRPLHSLFILRPYRIEGGIHARPHSGPPHGRESVVP